MNVPGGRWTVLLVREGEARSHRFALTSVWFLGLGLLVAAGVFRAGRLAVAVGNFIRYAVYAVH